MRSSPLSGINPSFPSAQTCLLIIMVAMVSSIENSPLDLSQIESLYTTFICFGPIARVCLESITTDCTGETYDESLREYLGDVDLEIQSLVASGVSNLEVAIYQHSSHKISLMCPDKSGLTYKARLATRWIAHRMTAATEEQAQQHTYKLFKTLARQSTLRTSAGWFFEAYAHDWFGKGGQFVADELPIDGTNSPLTFFTNGPQSTGSAAKINYFTNPEDLAQQVRKGLGGHGVDPSQVGKYFQPYAKNQESFDGVVFNSEGDVILLQYTVAAKHEIKSHGVQVFLDSMPATIKTIHIVFAVPADRAKDYSKAQKVPDSNALKWAGKQIRQYRLVFTDDDIKNVAVMGSHGLHDEEEVMDGGSGIGRVGNDGEDVVMNDQ
jgi:hypothetical protein